MRRRILRTALGAALMVVPGVAMAGIALSPIMQSWNHAKRHIDGMLSGRNPYDAATVQQDVTLYITDATMVANHVRGGSAQARDFAGRFAAFAADGRSALASVSQPAAFTARFSRMVGDCQSCHAAYNN